jgi:magnesium transporter
VLRVDPEAPAPTMRAFTYGSDRIEEPAVDDVDAIGPLLERWPVVWINVDGLGDAEVLRRLGTLFGLHRLALEDVVNVSQRAKVERYGEQLFIVARMPLAGTVGELATEQLSLFLGDRFVLSFQERPGDHFDGVRKRLREGKGRMRSAGPDYLAYALLDAVIDAYYPVLDGCGQQLDGLEEELFVQPRPEMIGRLHHIRRDLLTVRRAVWPLREAVSGLARDEDELVTDETRVYLRDCYDHTVQLIDLLENQRELGSGLRDMYLSLLSHRMNEIMKVLTIFAAIFIPLSFVAGLYGMNFDPGASSWNMPELSWPFGYPFALALMAAIALGLMLHFRRKGWIGQPEEQAPPGPGSVEESGR